MRNVIAAQNTFIRDISLTVWTNSKGGDTYSIQEWKVYDKLYIGNIIAQIVA